MKSSEIASLLHLDLHGEDIEVNRYATLYNIKENSIIFVKKFSDEYLEKLNTCGFKFLAIVLSDYCDKVNCSYIISKDPRLDFIRVLSNFFVNKEDHIGIHPSAVICTTAKIGEDVFVGANCYIGENVSIGDRTKIFPNTVVMDDTIIGKDCYIKSGVVIGQAGFGFENDENGIPVHFPHLGKVIIGNGVYIGANTAIDIATLEDTHIADNAKIDNLVHIAHNVHIDECSLVIAHAMIGGGVHIGKRCWISPNVSIKQQLKIGDDALLGMGAVIIHDVDNDTVIVGNPGKLLVKK